MIQIKKGDAPKVLEEKGDPLVQKYNAAFDLAPDAYKDGSKKFAIARHVYAHKTVLDELTALQHGKCAYCEYKIPKPFADTDIEHFRPKGAVKQADGEPEIRPGYYWLAYSWDNLLLACQFCNRNKKRTLFPLADPAARARSHNDRTENETPTFLKPDGREDPRRHIYFVRELPVERTPMGRATIDLFGLDKLEHVPRDDRLVALSDAHEIVTLHEGKPDPDLARTVAKSRRFLEQAVLASAPFSAMAIDFLAANPLPPAPVV